jgi:glycosyltransferase involved in cell wall biosynthesis/predicted O-methyltransferase YrrM
MSDAKGARPRVALLSNTLGIGGTEKGLVSFATELDRSRFEVMVVAVDSDGPRRRELEQAGIPVHVAHGEHDRLAELLRGVEIAHIFRAGTPEPLAPGACRAAGVAHVVETNIFGQVDRSSDEPGFACHLFMSQMCLVRYRARVGASNGGFHRRHKVLRFPIEHEQLRGLAPPKSEARRRLGLDPDRPVVGRVGRDADLKWRDLLVDMVPHLLRLAPDAQVLFVGATPAKRARLQALGVLDRCLLVEPTPDPSKLAGFYAACDVFVSAAEIGESQGLGLGEALALEVPVVTCSTPWADNAQVEFVEHGRSGWFASHPRSFAEAVADLLGDGERRRAFGAAGRADVERVLSPAPLVRQLERLYVALLAEEEPREWDPAPEQIAAFEGDYPRRAAAEFRPLAPRERAEVRAMRLRERLRTARAAISERGAGALRERAAGILPGRAGGDDEAGRGSLRDRIARLEEGGPARAAAHRGYLAVHHLAERAGLHVVRASYDSPMPVVRELPAEVFERESPLRAVNWRLDEQVRLLEGELAPYLAEFRPTAEPSAPAGAFRLDNHTYDRVDAELLYAIVRHLGPRRYVELGSGWSTLVAWQALQANAREGRAGELACFDPYPSPHVTALPELAERVSSVGAQELSERVVGELGASDVLFVDTSHTVKLGGDVNRIVLDLMPLLAPGVVVHFHDVFLPGDYSRGHLEGGHYWTEQYLLQAFLMYNHAWEVLASAQALVRAAPDAVARLIPSYRPGVSPGALWLRRREVDR